MLRQKGLSEILEAGSFFPPKVIHQFNFIFSYLEMCSINVVGSLDIDVVPQESGTDSIYLRLCFLRVAVAAVGAVQLGGGPDQPVLVRRRPTENHSPRGSKLETFTTR